MSALEHVLVPLNQFNIVRFSRNLITDVKNSMKLSQNIYHHKTYVHFAFCQNWSSMQ